MFSDVLSSKQKTLLPLIKTFGASFYLAGGTAIALQCGHRRSIDFDFFSFSELEPGLLLKQLSWLGYTIEHVMKQSGDELTVVVDTVRVSFIMYPFPIATPVRFEQVLRMPDLETLGAMKAYALGRRSKWKDYVDLYVLFKDFFTLQTISLKAAAIFGGAFNERLFREQLCYFEDVDCSEEVDFLSPNPPQIQEIQNFLIQVATS